MKTNQVINPAGLYEFQHESLNLLTGVLGVSKAVSYIVDEQARPICYKTFHMQPSMHREYMETYHKLDPLHPTQFSEQDATVVKMNDLISTQNRYNHPYYTDFISPWGVQDIVELFLRVENRLVAGFALFISKQQPELRSADINKAEQIHRYMQFSLEQSYTSPRQALFDQFCTEFQLTPKERMVVQLVAQGLPNKTIANDLNCSLATIKTHLQHIFAKLAVNSKTEVTSLLYKTH